MNALVSLEMTLLSKTLPALGAGKRPLPGVNALVDLEVAVLCETLAALPADIRLLS